MASQGAYGPPGAELQRLYDADAVDHYISQLQAHIQDLQRQVSDAVALAGEAQAKAAAAANSEAILGRALLSAQRAADQTIGEAERQAELLVAEARREADRLLSDVRADAQRIVDEAHQTVEAVFAALNAQREPQAEPEPEPEPAEGMFPPPPPPSTWSWAAPDPGTRQPDEDDGATAWEEPVDGRIVDLRPARPAVFPAPPLPEEREPTAGADWALRLGGTGTEGPLPALAARPAAESPPASLPEWAVDRRPWAEPGLRPAHMQVTVAEEWTARRPAAAGAAGGDARPAGSELVDRWRLARNGGPAHEEFLARPGQLESLADGSYVSVLRGEGAPVPAPPPERASRRWLRRPH